MFCTNCGCNLDDNAKFCHQCGKSLTNVKSGPIPGSVPPVNSEADSMPVPPAINHSTSRSTGSSGSGFFMASDLDNQDMGDQPSDSNGYGYEYGDFDDERTIAVRRPANSDYSSYHDSINNSSTASEIPNVGTTEKSGTEPYSNAYSNPDGPSSGPAYSNPGGSSSGPSYGNPSGPSSGSMYSTPSDDWKDELSPKNLEKFAPMAAFLPLVSGMIRFLLRFVLSNFFPYFFYFGNGFKIVRFVTLVFFIAALVATGYLIFTVVSKKNIANVNSWITPIGTLLATIACFGIWRYWRVFPIVLILTVVSVLMGLEFLARIVIAGKDIASPFNPGAAAATYSYFFKNYKDQYPTTKDLERAGYVDPEKSYFDGSGVELLGYCILTVIVCTVTCGLAFPWMYCKIVKWRLEHTVINDKRLTFTGSGASLFGHWILWEILTAVTCGIYGFFVYCALKRWELEHTFVMGEPIYANDKVSYFDGSTPSYIGYSILAGLGIVFTCGLATPWMMVMIQRWETEHEVINGRRLRFSGTGLGFLGEFLIIFILSLITCGIYSYWGIVRMNKYIIRNTDFIDYRG